MTTPLPYGQPVSLVVNGIRDQAVVPNHIAPDTTVQFIPVAPGTLDLGSAGTASLTTVLSNGVDMVATGRGTGSTNDQLSFYGQSFAGDFDIKLRLASFSASDIWAKAGLMARESLDPSSRFAATFAAPSMNGIGFESREFANSTPTPPSRTFPINFPESWLRLQRYGSNFVGYASYDGENWVYLGGVNLILPNIIHVGLAVFSHDTNATATARFRDLSRDRR
jgi:hypothetical protein